MRTKLKAEIENLKAIIAVEATAEGMDENVEDNEILFSSICVESRLYDNIMVLMLRAVKFR